MTGAMLGMDGDSGIAGAMSGGAAGVNPKAAKENAEKPMPAAKKKSASAATRTRS
jgi:hypothetical protein